MRLIGPVERGLAGVAHASTSSRSGARCSSRSLPCWCSRRFQSLRSLARTRRPTASSPRAVLWLWLLGPVTLLVLQPVKEPRHVAPCVVPAVLLAVMAIEAVPRRAWRRGLLAAGLRRRGAAVLRRDRHGLETPYFLDRAIHLDALDSRDDACERRRTLRGTPPALRALHWKYDHSFALVGFPAERGPGNDLVGVPGRGLRPGDLRRSAGVPGGGARRALRGSLAARGIRHLQPALWMARIRPRSPPRRGLVANADFVLWNAGHAGPRARAAFRVIGWSETIERSPAGSTCCDGSATAAPCASVRQGATWSDIRSSPRRRERSSLASCGWRRDSAKAARESGTGRASSPGRGQTVAPRATSTGSGATRRSNASPRSGSGRGRVHAREGDRRRASAALSPGAEGPG